MSEGKLSGVLEEAVKREEASYRMYLNASDVVENNEAKDTLRRLAEMEKVHKQRLQDLAAGTTETLATETVQDLKVSEFLNMPDISPEMDLTDVLAFAIKKEERAWHFYTHLASAVGSGEAKTLFETLSREELSHKNKVEQFYEAVLDQRIPYRRV